MRIRDGLEIDDDALAELCLRHRVRELALFGSVLRADFRDTSDIDVLVEFEPTAEIGFIALGSLKRALEDLLGRPVDLVSRRGLKPLIRDAVLSEARTLHAA